MNRRVPVAGCAGSVGVLACALMGFAGCFSLDPFLFNGQPLDHYSYDSYTGDRECTDAIDSVKALERAGLAPAVDSSTIRLYTIPSGGGTMYGALLASKMPPFDSIADTVFLYCHGKGPHIDDYWPRTRMLHATGYAVFVFDYRGFGMSPGTSSEGSIYEDGYTALRYLRDSLGNPRVVVYGYSLGSLVASEIASHDTHRQAVKFILEAPIGNFNTIVEDASFMDLPATYFTSYTGDNTQRIKSITVPFLWMHGTMDEVLDRETQGVPIWNNYTGDKGYYLKAVGARHQNIPQTMGYSRYINAVSVFCGDRADTSFTQIFAGTSAVEWNRK